MRSKYSSSLIRCPSFSICSNSPSTICWVSEMSRSSTWKLRSSSAVENACIYSQSPARTHFELPQVVLEEGRPRRVSASSMMSSWTSVAVWSISTTEPRRMRLWLVQPRALAESSRSKGRMRLPPPAMRYWAMSVMTSTFEADWVANSRSMAARSSRRRSKTSAAVAMESVLTRMSEYQDAGLVRAEIRELQADAEILATKKRHNILQNVAIFADD